MVLHHLVLLPSLIDDDELLAYATGKCIAMDMGDACLLPCFSKSNQLQWGKRPMKQSRTKNIDGR